MAAVDLIGSGAAPAVVIASVLAIVGTGRGAGVPARSVAVTVAVVAVRRTGRSHAAVAAGLPSLWAMDTLLSA